MEEPVVKREALSVSAAVSIAKSIMQEHTFKILGEVSELNNKPGYKAVYFTIKDENANLPCLMWKSRYQAMGVDLRIGSRIEVTGKFTIFAPKGRMNFDVSVLSYAGDGDLRQKVARLAQKLKDEGLMSPERKRSLVEFPHTIGLVTSPRGAAVHDVLRTLRRRCPSVRVLFAGVPVEGKTAHEDLSLALKTVAAAGAQEILLVRGGGSFEDLMPFNEELLARTIASLPVPVITGIGHEPDTSIADMVADVRASTPTAAAEAVSPHRDDLLAQLDSVATRMSSGFVNRLNRSRIYVDSLASRPVLKDPLMLFSTDMQMLDMLQDRLEKGVPASVNRRGEAVSDLQRRLRLAIPSSLNQAQVSLDSASSALSAHMAGKIHSQQQLNNNYSRSLSYLGSRLMDGYCAQAALATSRLNDLSPLRTLERGWSITKDSQGSVVKSVEQTKPDDKLSIQVVDGVISCKVENVSTLGAVEIVSLEE